METEQIQFLNRFGELFVKFIREELAKPYPYAPGKDGNRPKQGDANKIAGVGFGYTQNLYDSVSYLVSDNNELNISMNSYWRNVNFGRDAGSYVPIRPLEYWAAFRLGLNDKEAKSMAYGISNNIKKFGIAPTYFYDTALERMLDEGVSILGSAFENRITNIINEMLFETDINYNQDITINL